MANLTFSFRGNCCITNALYSFFLFRFAEWETLRDEETGGKVALVLAQTYNGLETQISKCKISAIRYSNNATGCRFSMPVKILHRFPKSISRRSHCPSKLPIHNQTVLQSKLPVIAHQHFMSKLAYSPKHATSNFSSTPYGTSSLLAQTSNKQSLIITASFALNPSRETLVE
jgi:hypothetical protein